MAWTVYLNGVPYETSGSQAEAENLYNVFRQGQPFDAQNYVTGSGPTSPTGAFPASTSQPPSSGGQPVGGGINWAQFDWQQQVDRWTKEAMDAQLGEQQASRIQQESQFKRQYALQQLQWLSELGKSPRDWIQYWQAGESLGLGQFPTPIPDLGGTAAPSVG